VVTRPDDPATTAARPAEASTAAGAQGDGAVPKAAAPALAPQLLGNLGDVSTADALRSAVDSARAAGAATSENADSTAPACASAGLDALGLVQVSGVGTGVTGGVGVTILVGTDAAGGEVAVAVAADDCRLLLRAPIGT
jgi:hypothetical protein